MNENTSDQGGEKGQQKKQLSAIIDIIFMYCADQFAAWRRAHSISEEVFDAMSMGVEKAHADKLALLLKRGERAFAAASQTYIDLVGKSLVEKGLLSQEALTAFQVDVIDPTSKAVAAAELVKEDAKKLARPREIKWTVKIPDSPTVQSLEDCLRRIPRRFRVKKREAVNWYEREHSEEWDELNSKIGQGMTLEQIGEKVADIQEQFAAEKIIPINSQDNRGTS